MSLDAFIHSTSKLLAAYPSTSKVSITYSNEHKKITKKSAGKSPKSASNCIKVKVFEPSLGKCIKYKTFKSKELSKLLTFLGPHGVTSNESKVPGLSSIMANKTFEEEKIEKDEPKDAKDDKKKKKKKGKK